MRCDYCNENEANNTFIVNFMGEEKEVHLCDECTHKAKQYYEAMRQESKGFPGWGGSNVPARRRANPFPLDAGKEIRQRRHLNQLHARLREAVNAERYEDAAKLRDEIAGAEKDVFVI